MNLQPRMLFIVTRMPVFLMSVSSMILYYPKKHEKAEYAQLVNQGALLFICGIVHFLGGWFSFSWNIDYRRYKPLAACICWNAWLLVILVSHISSIILYNEMWYITILSAQLTCLVAVISLVLWQISVHWKLFKNGQQNQAQQNQTHKNQTQPKQD